MNAENNVNVYAPTEVPVDDVPQAGEVHLAERWKRLVAALADALIVGLPVALVAYLMLGSFAPADGGLAVQMGFTLIAGALHFGLYALLNWKPLEANGQTIGKRLMNIRIERMDGSPVGARHALFRRYLPVQAASLVPFIGGILALVDALFIFRASQRCLHDTFADTRVVDA